MGVEDLQTFLTGTTVAGGTVPAELLRIARSTTNKQTRSKKRDGPGGQPSFSLVVDVECCLDRLYGGFYSDWVSGGQWSRMVQFLAVLNQTVQSGNIELVFFFNGSLESQRMSEWVASQLKARQNVNEVLKHTSCKGTPPPKIWWVPPTCLRTALRMAMRHLHMTTVCSMDDHRQEAIAYLRENGLHGLVADDVEYAVFDPPRYFSASHLKMTYKGMVETVEYQISELSKALDLPQEQFCVLAALLGNYLLSPKELTDFYENLGLDPSTKMPSEVLVKRVADFVKTLTSPNNLDSIAVQVFGSLSDKRAARLKQSIQYYKNGTKDGFLMYCQPSVSNDLAKSKSGKGLKAVNGEETNGESADLDTSKFASETQESEQESLAAYNEATAALNMKADIVDDHPVSRENGISEEQLPQQQQHLVNGSATANQAEAAACVLSSSSSSSSSTSSGTSSPAHQQTRGKEPAWPPVAPEVIRTSSERHQKGLMSPYITQILTQGEIRLPVLMEDERHREIPSIHLFYRPVRQMVYAILFNLHHHKYIATRNKIYGNKEGEKDVKSGKEKDTDKTEIPDVVIKEWVWSKTNQYEQPDLVHAEQIGWGVPTIHRLWFGSTIDDKRRRLRAFLTCMRSDTALMLNPVYVPQHLLVLACVLRYIMSSSDQILREQELDAIIVQAVCPELMNVQYLQDLQLSVVTTRGIQLGTLIMAGVETALLVNDACGAPVPWLMCCPWLYFDGKLLQHTLARAAGVKNLRALCGNRMDQVVKVQKMRQAILEGLTGQFARAPLPAIAPNPGMRMNNMMPRAGLVGGWHANRAPAGSRGGLLRRPVPSRGGQLEVAGVVVGCWGANYGSRNAHSAAHSMSQRHSLRPMPPQITSVGVKQYRMGGAADYGVGAMTRQGQRPTYPVRGQGTRAAAAAAPCRGKKLQVPKKRNSNSGSGAKKILTSKDNVDKKFADVKRDESTDSEVLTLMEGIKNSVLISESVEGHFNASPLNGDKKRDEATERVDLGQGDGQALAPALSTLATDH